MEKNIQHLCSTLLPCTWIIQEVQKEQAKTGKRTRDGRENEEEEEKKKTHTQTIAEQTKAFYHTFFTKLT